MEMPASPAPEALSKTRPPLPVIDHMVMFMLDNIGINGGVTVDDLTLAGFSADDIGDYAHQAAKIARRRARHCSGLGLAMLVFAPPSALAYSPPSGRSGPSPAPPPWVRLMKSWGMFVIQTFGFLALMAVTIAPLWWLTP